MFPIMAGNSASTGYNLTRSLRVRNGSYLNRANASPTNNKIWTWSSWVKRGGLADGYLLTGGNGTLNYGIIGFQSNSLSFFDNVNTTNLVTTQVFRDPSAWYHFVIAVDTTQATASNRIKIYVNGVQITSFSTGTYPAQNTTGVFNVSGYNAGIGGVYYTPGSWQLLSSDFYLAEQYFVDGLQLTPSSFGSTNALTGVWQPARYTGTYGTNGFYLPFTDNSALTTSSNVGLGKDFSGNGNYWTTNNISITAGVTYDSMTDVPTLTSATAANYCVMNPLAVGATTSTVSGNLNVVNTATLYWDAVLGTMGFSSGKYYWEMTTDATYPATVFCGIAGIDIPYGINNLQDANSTLNTYGSLLFCDDGQSKLDGNARAAYSTALTAGQVLGVAVDKDAKTCVFYKNGVSLGSISFSSSAMASKTIVPFVISYYSGSVYAFNFGQRPFAYTPPTGFVALNTFNLPTSTILQGNKVMDATLYTGTGASLSVTNAASFKPDLVWVKGRSGATDHALYDSVRGTTKQLESNTTGAETTEATGLTSFGSAGFTVGALAQMNTSAATYVGWQWQAGQGSSSSNTNGTITSTVSVNASAGFSVVTWSATNAAATIGHGLGVAPSLIIVKDRATGFHWAVYHASVGNTAATFLNLTNAANTNVAYWNNTSPTSSVFSVNTQTNYSTDPHVAYCWTPIAGFSSFGSYSGNGSTDGPMIYTGFQPKFVLLKNTNTSIYDWWIYDSIRNSYNQANLSLQPDLSSAETNNSNISIDTLSNGFKLRGTNSNINGSGNSYIYAAFATSPFKNSLAF